jgi:hypothetical protein
MKIKDLFKRPVYPIKLYDKDNNHIYYEELNGFWWKAEYLDGKEVYYEDSNGYCWKRKYLDGNQIYYENSNGYWYKQEYLDGKEVYYESSNGTIHNNCPKKELTVDEIAAKFNIPVEQLKIKK